MLGNSRDFVRGTCRALALAPSLRRLVARLAHDRKIITADLIALAYPAFIAATYLALSLLVLALWTSRGIHPVTGDEPHFLIMARGIAKHATFEQTLPYQDEARDKLVSDGTIDGYGHVIKGPHGLYNNHNVGLPILLVVPFTLWGAIGAKLFMILMNASCIIIAWKVSGLFGSNSSERFWAVAAVCLAFPLLPASSQIYTDLLGGILALSGLYWMMTADRERPQIVETLWAAALVCMPWLHVRFWAASAILLIAIAGKSCAPKPKWSRLIKMAVLCALFWSALIIYNHHAFGGWFLGPFQGGDLAPGKTSLMTLFGIAFDQNQGFLMQNPLTLVGLLAIGPLFRREWQFTLVLALVFSSFIVPNAMHPNWYGGGSFSGRYSWACSTVFLVPVLYALAALHRMNTRVFFGLIGASMTLQAWFFVKYAIEGVRLYNRSASWPASDYSILYRPFDSWLPMLYNSEWAFGYAPNYVWLALVLLLIVLGFVSARLSIWMRLVDDGHGWHFSRPGRRTLLPQPYHAKERRP